MNYYNGNTPGPDGGFWKAVRIALIAVLVLYGVALPIAKAAHATTIPQAKHAIAATGNYPGQQAIDCHAHAGNVTCQVGAGVCYTDQVFGPSTIWGTVPVRVTRRRHVHQTGPEQFAVWAGVCNGV